MISRAGLVLLAALIPEIGRAQVVLSTLVGTTETPVGSTYTFQPITANTTEDVTFRVRGTGSTAVTITKLAQSGIGFAIVNTSTIPVTIAPGNAFDFTMRFVGGPVGSYSANLQVNTLIVALQGSVVTAATVSAGAPCIGPDLQGIISFGRIAQTQQATCTITLANPYTQALTISPFALTGAAFKASLPASGNIPAGQSITFALTFTAATATTFNGALTVGVRTYPLIGTGFLSPLPAPVLSFDTAILHSGEQHTLTAALPTPAVAAVTGTITLKFTPQTGAGTLDDAAIQFVATSKRVLNFSVAQGSTAMLLNGQSGVIFSTGTTAGTISFLVDAGVIGIGGNAITSVTITPAPMSVASAGASAGVGAVDVSVSGFDNTYSAGKMSFTFFDRSGNALGAAIPADFSSSFHAFYLGQTAGSAFLMRVAFPVTGNVAAIGSVDVQLSNTAGSVTVQQVKFP